MGKKSRRLPHPDKCLIPRYNYLLCACVNEIDVDPFYILCINEKSVEKPFQEKIFPVAPYTLLVFNHLSVSPKFRGVTGTSLARFLLVPD